MTTAQHLPLGSAKDLGFCPQRTRNLVEVLQAEVARARLPGAVALIARHGQVLLHETVGQQDPANGVPMANVMFPAASVGVMVLPLMIFHQIQLMVCAVLARRYREQQD